MFLPRSTLVRAEVSSSTMQQYLRDCQDTFLAPIDEFSSTNFSNFLSPLSDSSSADFSNFSSSESRSAYRGVYHSIAQNDRLNQLDRTVRKVFELLLKNSARQSITVFLWRWAIDRLTSLPYSRWRSRLVDRLLIAIEGGGGSNV